MCHGRDPIYTRGSWTYIQVMAHELHTTDAVTNIHFINVKLKLSYSFHRHFITDIKLIFFSTFCVKYHSNTYVN